LNAFELMEIGKFSNTLNTQLLHKGVELKKDAKKLLLYGKQYQKIANAAKIKLLDGCAKGEVMDPMSF